MSEVAAYQADGRPIARDAFYALACDPRRSVAVEACAGAGKTWMLVSRILRALLEGAQPHEILAITFTRKAAGEMRERLNEWLHQWAAPNSTAEARIQALVERGVPSAQALALEPTLAGLHERLLIGGRAVEVRTFHAWFSQLLRAAPLELLNELGLHGGMELIEDLEDHRADVLRRFHAAVLRDAGLQSDHAELIARRGRHQAQAWFDAALDKRVEIELADAAGVLDDSVEAPSGAFDASGALVHPAHALLGAAWKTALRDLALALALGGVRAQDAATGLVTALAQRDAQAAFEHAWRALFTDKGTPRKQLGQVAALAGVQGELEAIALQVRQYDAHLEHGRMVRLSRVLLAEFAAYKRARGLADMSDLERCGLALLRDASLAAWVQERLDARIRHVLIDEFQDTSPLQWHALHAWLSAYAGAGGGASGQRAPGVFIVGDPKQSIYRFRRAEPRVFAAARTFVVEGLGGTWLTCDHTRRNAPEVLAVLNRVFEAAAQAGEFDGFRAHTTEIGARLSAAVLALARVSRPPRAAPERAAAPAEWRDTLRTPRLEAEELLREQEAAHVAQAVQELVQGQGWRPGDVFVLSRKRQSLRLVAQALRRVHQPYAAVEELELMVSPQARDLVALLDVLASPRHRLSLAQTLRSPLFGASDADLIALAQRSHGGDWWATLMQAPSEPGGRDVGPGGEHGHGHDALSSPALCRARRLLSRWQVDAGQLPPHDLLDRIVHEGELRERVAATLPAEQRLAALEAIDAVLAQSLTLDGARYATPYNFVRALKRRVIRMAPPTRADAVQLLTVHGAKGLEARAVFVMDSDPEPPRAATTTLLVDWPVESAWPRRCAFVYSEAACPPSLVDVLAREIEARRREELNGLYVAMSRARERLVFSATEPRYAPASASWWERAAPLASPWGVPVAPPGPAGNAGASEATLRLKTLPRWQPPAATAMPVAPPDGGANPDGTAANAGASRLGQAVHRVLEWGTAGWINASGVDFDVDIDTLARAAANEFGAPFDEVVRVARTILHSPQCRRFFGGPALHWCGNEVPVSDRGEVLRIDRLVRLQDEDGAPTWWVLDYKLQHAPHQLAAYREQLLRYRDAVRRLQPGDTVRCAFVTGAGTVVELE